MKRKNKVNPLCNFYLGTARVDFSTVAL